MCMLCTFQVLSGHHNKLCLDMLKMPSKHPHQGSRKNAFYQQQKTDIPV